MAGVVKVCMHVEVICLFWVSFEVGRVEEALGEEDFACVYRFCPPWLSIMA